MIKNLSDLLVKSIIEEGNIKNIVVTYSGRFQPFHMGHYYAYNFLVKLFGKQNIYITTSNKIDINKSPLSFNDKQKFISSIYNISKSNIIEVKNPYSPKELLNKFDENVTVLIVGLGEKDINRLSSGKYYSQYSKNKTLLPFKEAGYYIKVPQIDIRVGSDKISGTIIRTYLSDKDKSYDMKKKFAQRIFGKNINENDLKSLIKKFGGMDEQLILKYDELIEQIVSEVTVGGMGGHEIDDGPTTWYPTYQAYSWDARKMASSIGWTIINFMLGDKKGRFYDDKFKEASFVTYGPIHADDSEIMVDYQKLLGSKVYKKWVDKINKLASMMGWKFITRIDSQDREDYLSITDNDLFTATTSTSTVNENVILNEGGAYGHIQHPFEDNNLTFGDFKILIKDTLSGNLIQHGPIELKTDGVNIMISWSDTRNELVASRNKSHLKNNGKDALNKFQIIDFLKGRGALTDAFKYALVDLENAIRKINVKTRSEIFEDGANWMSLEIIYPQTANVIPYNKSLLVFHELLKLDINGNLISKDRSQASTLAKLIKDVNADVQKKFSIDKTTSVDLPPNSKNFTERVSYYLQKLNKIQSKYGLKDNDTISIYHEAKWEEIINDAVSKNSYNIPKDIFNILIRRGAYSDKSVNITKLKKQIDNEGFRDWVDNLWGKDNEIKQILEKNIEPFERLFLELGVEVMINIKTFMAANPSKALQKIKNNLDSEINKIRNSKDINAIQKMEKYLSVINSLGGFEKIVPSEGITFHYKNKIYKYTGIFSPLNKLLGIIRYAK